jgi:hypothetical protein
VLAAPWVRGASCCFVTAVGCATFRHLQALQQQAQTAFAVLQRMPRDGIATINCSRGEGTTFGYWTTAAGVADEASLQRSMGGTGVCLRCVVDWISVHSLFPLAGSTLQSVAVTCNLRTHI